MLILKSSEYRKGLTIKSLFNFRFLHMYIYLLRSLIEIDAVSHKFGTFLLPSSDQYLNN